MKQNENENIVPISKECEDHMKNAFEAPAEHLALVDVQLILVVIIINSSRSGPFLLL